MATGKVYLVGAGPGDPGLVTLRAAEVLARADVVLYDYLANPAILRHCRPDALLVSLGKHGSGRVKTQAEINELMASLTAVHKIVVRLKNGDPMVFGRAGEELGYLRSHGIEFEIVPGVTAAVAAASYAGIAITHRDEASAVALVTGHEDAEKTDSTLDFDALTRFPGTLVFYMGVTTVEHWSRSLVTAGKPATTPVAILRRVSLPDQRRIDATLDNVAAVVREQKLRPPVVFVVGEVAARDAAFSWFDKRPLFGQRVLVTRATHQADDLARPLAELGAEVLYQPAIEIRPPIYWSPVDQKLERLHELNWLVFSSSNGVRMLLDRLLASGVREHPDGSEPTANVGVIGRLTPPARRDLRVLGNVKLAAIGPGTADELARYHLQADLIPDEFRAESLALALQGSAAGKRFLLVRASRGREVLAEELTKAGGIVEQVVVYDSIDVQSPAPDIAEQMAAGRIDWTTVTSSAIARSLVRMFGDSLHKTKLVSISPITTSTLRELGHEPAAEAGEYTMAGVVTAIENH